MSRPSASPMSPRWRGRFGAALLLGALLAACAAGREPAASAQSTSASPRARIWDYQVHAAPGARELRIDAELPPGVPEELGLDAFAHPFLRELEIETERGWRPLARTGRRWLAPRCRERGCRLRYTYRLAAAARHIDRFAYAGYRAGVLLAPPSTFLLAPQDYSGSDTYRFSVHVAPGEAFVTGVYGDPSVPAPPHGARYAAPASVLFQAPYSAFGKFERERLDVGGGALDVALAPGDLIPQASQAAGDVAGAAGVDAAPGAASHAELERGVLGPARRRALGVSRAALRSALLRAAAAVSGYYGRFPVPEASVIVLPGPGDDIFGMQLGNGGASIVLFIGAGVDDEQLRRDWVITHELLHLGFPTLGRRYLWLAEGLATYQEPIARARAGIISETELWRLLLEGMPKGLPSPSDGGLDGSMRWGRTYWGGALFCLLLDVEIRARSDNRLSLDSAARAILSGGGDTSVRWSLEQTLAAGDAALDRPSLAGLYAEHAAAPVEVDLDGLFRRLGVRRAGEGVVLDDAAELAHVRRAIARADRPRSERGSGRPRSPETAIAPPE